MVNEDNVFTLDLSPLANVAGGLGRSFTVAGAPSWLSLNGASLSGTPTLSTHAGTYNFTVTVTDSLGRSASSPMRLDVSAVNDAPEITLSTDSNLAYTENDAAKLLDGAISLSDEEGDTITAATITISAGRETGDTLTYDTTLAAGFGISETGTAVATDGSLELTGNATAAQYQQVLQTVRFVSTNEDPSASKSISFSVTDGTDAGSASRSIDVTAVIDAPVLATTSTGAQGFGRGGDAVRVDSQITLSDLDTTSFPGGNLTVSITDNNDTTDRLSIANDGTATGQIGFDGTTVTYGGTSIGTVAAGTNGVGTNALTVTLNANASIAAVQALARAITFDNTDASLPEADDRTVQIVLTDAAGTSSNTFTRVIDVVDNANPTHSGNAALNVNEDATLTIATSTFSNVFQDSDGADSFQAVKINTLPPASAGVLKLSGTDVNIGQEISKADLDAGNLTFVPAADFNGAPTFTFSVGDGKAFATAPATATITVAPVDDAPRITASGGKTVGAPVTRAILVDPGLAIVDPDATGSAIGTYADTGTGYLQANITTGRLAGDFLSIKNIGTGSGQIGFDGTNITYAGTTIGTIDGTLNGGSNQALRINLNGNASNDAVQALGQAITIEATDKDQGSSSNKVVTFSASDGQNVSTNVTRTVEFGNILDDDFSTTAGARVVLSADGSNDSVTLSNATYTNFVNGNQAFTWEAWVRPDVNNASTDTILSIGEFASLALINNSFGSNVSGVSGNATTSLGGNATLTGGVVRLTDSVNNQLGTFTIDPSGDAEGAKNFTASFRMKIGESTSGISADGLSFNYGNTTYGSTHTGNGRDYEEGVTNGLSIAFDTYDNDDGGPDTAHRLDVLIDGTVVTSVAIPGGSRTSQSTHAAQFDGSNDILHRQNDANLVDTGSMTIEAWIKPDTYPSGSDESGIVAIGGPRSDANAPASNQLFLIQLLPDGRIRAFHEDDDRVSSNPGADQEVVFNNPAIPLNEWSHIAVVRDASGDGGTYSLYINGQFSTSGTYTHDPDGGSTTDLMIGAQFAADGTTVAQGFDGQIDDVRIWGDVRNGTEIGANYNKELNENGNNLIAHYTFDNSLTTDESSSQGSQTLTNVSASRATIPDSRIEAEFVDVTVSVTNDNRLTVTYDGSTLLNNYTLNGNYAPQTSDVFSFGARTGGANDKHEIDNVQITVTDAGTRAALVVKDGKLQFVTEDRNGETFHDSGTNIQSDGNFHHVAASYNGSGGLTLYVDGQPVKTFTGLDVDIQNGNLTLLRDSKDNADFFDGLVAELRSWTGARSDADILQNYLPNMDAVTANMNGYWRFDSTSSSYTDLSGDNHTATRSGTSTTTATLFPAPGSDWVVVESNKSSTTNDYAYVDNGELVIQNRELVRTADQIQPSTDQPIHVTGTFTFTGAGSDFMSVITRADTSAQTSFGDPNNGLAFAANADQDRIEIIRISNGNYTGLTETGDASINLTRNAEYRFDVYDDGSNLRFSVTEIGNPSNTANVTATDSTSFGTNYVVLTNREDTTSNPEHVVRIDNIRIDQDILIEEATTYTGTLPSTGLSGTLTFSILEQPEHGTLTITNASTGAYTYTPASGYHGADSFNIQVSDGNGNVNAHTVGFNVQADVDVQVAGSSLSFDGTNDYVDLGKGTSDQLAITGDLTIEGWVKLDRLTGDTQHIAAYTSDASTENHADNFLYQFGVLSDGRVYLNHETGGGGNSDLTTTATVAPGEWVHLAAVRDTATNTQTIYINGIEAASTTYSNEADGGTSANAKLTLGGALSSGNVGALLDGQMDEVRIWNDARSADDIRLNYDQQVSPSDSGLVAYYRFDDVVNGEVKDLTSNNNDGHLGATDTIGDSAEPTVVNPASGRVLSLDGVDDYVVFPDTLNIGTSFTVETWAQFDPTNSAGGGHVFSLDNVGSDTSGAPNWEIGHNRIVYEKNNANSFLIDPDLEPGSWNHYALVVTDQGGGNSEVKVYVNGGLIHTATIDTISVTNNELLIGRRGFANDGNFDGRLDDYRVWNTARTADEIAQNYQNTLTGSHANLIANISFDGGTATDLVTDDVGALNGGASIVNGFAEDKLADVYGSVIEVVENNSASGFMVADDALSGTVSYAIADTANSNTPVTSLTTANQGTVTIDTSTGQWTYTPRTNFSGSDSFTLLANGSTSGTDTETITINVAGGSDENSVGMPDGVLQLDGDGDYVNVSHDNALNFGTGAFTIEAWGRAVSDTTNNVLVSKIEDENQGSEGGWSLRFLGDPTRAQFHIQVNGTTKAVAEVTGLTEGQYYHLAGVREADGTIRLYVDGVERATSTDLGAVSVDNAGRDMRIGSDQRSSGVEYTPGNVDEVRIWNDARTADEISLNYQKQLAGNENSLVAYYRFDENQGTTVTNHATASGATLNGTLVGDAKVINPPTKALRFDGTNQTGVEATATGDLLVGNNSFTVETWFNTTTTGIQTLMSLGLNDGSGGVALRLNNGDLQVNRSASANDNTAELTVNTNAHDGLWHHAAFVFDSNAGRGTLYLDGAAVGEVSLAGFGVDAGNLRLGTGLGGGNDYTGDLGNVRVWSTARTAEQIQDNMNEVLAGSESGLVANYVMDSLTGGTLEDTAGTHNLSNSGDATLVTVSPTIQGTGGTTLENQSISGQMTANDVAGTPSYTVTGAGATDADGRVTATTANGGSVVIDTVTGAWTYTPANNWYSQNANDVDSFVLTANGENSTTDSETISITVNNDGEASVVINDGAPLLDGANGTQASGSIGSNTLSNQMTMRFDLHVTDLDGSGQSMVSLFDTTGNNARFVADISTSGNLRLFTKNSGNANNTADSGFTLSENTSYDVAMTYDGSTVKIYIDGALVHSESLSGMSLTNTAQSINIGTRFDGTNNPTHAVVDNVQVWSTAKSHQQIIDETNQTPASGANNLVAFYSFDDQVSATTVQDKSGNNYDLTLNGTAKIVNNLNAALSFDGTGDQVVVPHSADLALNGDFTIETWIKATGAPSIGSILTKENQFVLGRWADGSIQVAFSGQPANTFNWVDTGYDVALNTWTHLSMSYDESERTVKLYANGELVSFLRHTQTNELIPDTIAETTNAIQIGGRTIHNEYFQGQIGDLRIWNDVRTDEEIAANWNQELIGNQGGSLVAHFEFKETSGQTVNDSAGSNNGTLGANSSANADDPTQIDLDNDQTSTTLVIQEDETATGRLLGNDVPGTPSYSLQTAAPNGTVTLNADGTWSYVPREDFYGQDTFTLRVSGTDANGTVYNDDETITVTVNSVSDGNSVNVADGALSLDGTNDYVSVPVGTVNNLSTGTIETWVYLDANANETIFSKQHDGSNSYGIFGIGHSSSSGGGFTDQTDGKVYFRALNTGDLLESSATLQTGQWYHLALSFTGSEARLYVNGDLDMVQSGNFAIPDDTSSGTSQDARIGSWKNNASTFDGRIEEFRVWSDVRTAEEIRDNYDQQLTGSEANLQAYYRFDDDTDGNVVQDLTSNNHNGTLTNGADIGSSGATVFGNALEIQTSETAGGTMTLADVPTGGTFTVVGGTSNAGTTTLTTTKGGTVSLNESTGAWTYTPASGYYGADSFTLRASYTNNSQTMTDDEAITVTVKSDNNVDVNDGVLNLDGTNDHITIAHSNDLDIGDGQSFTLELWANLADTTTLQSLLDKSQTGADNANYRLFVSQGEVRFWSPNSGDIDPNFSISANEWTHISVSYDAANDLMTFFKNGEVVGNGISVSAIGDVNTGPLYIGRDYVGRFTQGSIDDVRVWEVARSPEEIRENHDQKLTGSESGLAGNWNFDDFTGTTVQDSTSNNNDGTLTNGAQVVNTAGPSLDFSVSSTDFVTVSGLDAALKNSSMTIEYWGKRDVFNSTDIPIGILGSEGSNSSFLHFGYVDLNTVRFSFSGNQAGVNELNVTDSGGGSLDEWVHWAATYDADTKLARVYRNGELVGTEVFTDNFNGTANFIIGHTGNTGHHYDGAVNDVRVWNTARTGEEIAANYNTTLVGNQNGALIAHYTFEEESGNTATNVANPGTYDGTITGSTRIDESPALYGRTLTVDENETVQGDMSAAGADGSATFSAGTPSNGGTVSIDSTGRWTYRPAENFNGTETFTLTATGAQGTIDTETITVTINPDAAKTSPVSGGRVLVLSGDSASNDHMTVQDDDTLDMAGAWTLETWVYLDEVSTLQNLIDKSVSGGVNYRLFVDNGHIGVFSHASTTVKTADNIVTAGEWNHIAVSYSGSQVTFYLNGEAVGNPQNFNDDPANTGSLFIGRDDAGRHVNGMMDDVRIWSVERTADEIRDNYDQLVPSNSNGLAANYIFDGSNGTTVSDRSQNSNDGTLQNGAKVKAIPTHSIELDGSNDIIEGPNLGSFSNLTFETWLHLDSLEAGAHGVRSLLVGDAPYTNQSTAMQITTSTGVMEYGENNNGVYTAIQFDDFDFRTIINEWNHIAVVKDTTNDIAKLLVNGEVVSTVALTGYLASSTTTIAGARIGGWQPGQERTIDGQMADVRIWNTARTEQEIADNFEKTLSGNQNNTLVANYQFKETSGQTVIDSANSNNATLGDDGNVGTDDPVRSDPQPNVFGLEVAIAEDQQAQGVMTANDVVPTSAQFGVSATSSITGALSLTIADKGTVNIDQDTGAWTFDPVAGFNGQAQFYLTASGGGETDAEQVTVNVTAVDVVSVTPPTAFVQFADAPNPLKAADSASLDITGDLTIEMWINPTSASTAMLINKEGSYEIQRLADGSIEFALFGSPANAWNFLDTGYDAPLNTWTHLSMVYDASERSVDLYANGQLVGHRDSADGATNANLIPESITPTNETLSIGGREFFDTATFQGQMADVRIWNTARTGEEVRDNYQTKLTGSETGLQAYYTFDDSQGASIQDRTSNNNDLEPRSSALSLDGANQYVRVNTNTDLQFDTTESFTLETWVTLDDITTELIGFFDAGVQDTSDHTNFRFGSHNGNLYLYSNDGTTFYNTGTGEGLLQQGIPQHVAVTYNANDDTVQFYLNGEAVATEYSNNNGTIARNGDGWETKAVTPSYLYIGTDALAVNDDVANINTVNDRHLDGSMDNTRIWKVHRDAADIRENYNKTLSGDQGGNLILNFTYDADSTQATDRSGSTGGTNTGSLMNGASISQTVGTPLETGIDVIHGLDKALSLDGSTQYMTAGNLGDSFTSLTFEAWLNLDNITDDSDLKALLFSDDAWSAGDAAIQFSEASGFLIWSENINDTLVSVTFDDYDFRTVLNEWHHVAVVKDTDAGLLRLSVDGNVVSSKTLSGDIATSEFNLSAARIGGYASNDVRGIDGEIADVRIWNTARSADEIADNYNTPISGNQNGQLIAHYDFKNVSGATVSNSGTTQSSGAIEFSGVSQYMTIANDNVFDNRTQGTIETWVYLDDNSSGTFTLAQKDFVNTTSWFGVGDANNVVGAETGKLFFHPRNGVDAIGNTVLQTGQWYHVAVAFDATEARFYVNGQLDAAVAMAAPPSGTATVPDLSSPLNVIGQVRTSGGATADPLDGRMDDLRIWNVKRSAEEIADNYQQTLTGNQGGNLVAHYTFEEGSGSTATDTAGSNNGTLVGNPTRNTDTPQVSGGNATLVGSPTVVDAAPDLVGTSLTIDENAIAQGSMTSNDVVGTATYSVHTAASVGTVTIDSSTGQWTYTPPVNYSGSATFTLQATGGGLTDQETITVTVQADNDPNVSGNVFQFDGQNSYVKADIGSNTIATNFTFEYWANFDNFATDQNPIRIDGTGSNEPRLVMINVANDTEPELFVGDNNGQVRYTGGFNYTAGEWKHVAVTYDGTTLRFYEDGVARSAHTVTIDILNGTGAQELFFGTDVFTSAGELFDFNGQMDDVRIWNVARSPEEIAAYYDKKLTGSETGLQAYYTADGIDGTTVNDQSTNNRDGTIEGGQSAPVILPSLGRAMTFDSVDDNITVDNDTVKRLDIDVAQGTWSVWFKTDGTWVAGSDPNNYATLINMHGVGVNDAWTNGLEVLVHHTGQVNVRGRAGSTSNVIDLLHEEAGLVDNQWHNLTVTFDQGSGSNGTASLYIDGAKVDTVTGVSSWDFANSDLIIGDNTDTVRSKFKGDIADVRVYDRILSDAEIAAGMTDGLPSNDSGLKLHLDMANVDENRISDQAGGNNIATVNGNPTTKDTAPDIEGNSIEVERGTEFVGSMTGADVTGTANFTILQSPAHGTLKLDSKSGTWTYTPNADYVGADSFTVRATGATSGTDDEVIAVTVTSGEDDNPIPTQTALQFDGINDYIDVGPMSANISGGFGFETWVKFDADSFTNNQWIKLFDFAQGAGDDNLVLGIDTANDDLALHIYNGATRSTLDIDYITPTDEWIHVAGFNDGAGTSYLYINGEVVATATGQQIAQDVARESNYIGQSNWPGQTNFKGEMAEARVWNTFRSAEEVKATYDKQLVGNEDGLLAYYTFDDVTGNVAADSTSNNNDAAIKNESAAPTAGVLSLDGNSDFVRIAHDNDLNPAQWTVEAWFNTSHTYGAGAQFGRIVSKGLNAAANQYSLGMSGGNVWLTTNNGGGFANIATTGTFNDGEWHHAAGTYDGTHLRLYIDGVLQGSPLAVGSINTGSNVLTIGAYETTDQSVFQHWNGQIDNVRVWDTARSQDAIRESMTETFDGATANLITQYTFDQIGTTTAINSGGTGHSGSLVGTAAQAASTTTPVKPSSSDLGPTGNVLNLDGSGDYVTASNPITANSTFSIEFWAKRDTDTTDDMVIGSGGYATNVGLSMGWRGPAWPANQFTFGFFGNDLNFTNESTGVGEWIHWAATYDSATNDRKLYKNGELVAQDTAPADYQGTDTIIDIGRDAAGNHDFDGQLDNVRIWTNVRTAEQIAEGMSRSYDHDTANLAIQYTFDDVNTSTSTVGDGSSTGGRSNGTLTGDASIADSGSGAPISVQIDNAIRFDGSGDTVDMGAVVGPTGNDARTIMVWAKTSSTNEGYFFSQGGTTAGTALGMGFARIGIQGLAVTVDTASGAVMYQPNTGVSDGQWHHYAIVVPDQANATVSDVMVYQDGVLLRTTVNTFSPTTQLNTSASDQNFKLGEWVGSTRQFDGDLAQVQVWNSALTTAQVNQYMTNPPAGSETGLVGYWPGSGDGASTPKVQDFSSGNNDGTLVGNATIVDAAPDIQSNSVRIAEGTIATGQMTGADVSGTATYAIVNGSTTTNDLNTANVGRLTIDATTGVWNFTPDAAFSGTHTFSLRASGQNGSTDTESVTVRVGHDPVAPTQYAVHLDGTDDFVTAKDAGAALTGTGDFTYEIWFKTDNTTGTRMDLLSIGNADSSLGTASYLYIDTDQQLNFGGAFIAAPATTTNTVTDGDWHHAAVTYTGSTRAFTLYLDGQVAASETLGTALNITQGEVAIGNSVANFATNHFDGEIAEARIWGSVRTTDQIANNYDRTLNGDEQGLLGYWNFNEGAGNIANDLSGNGQNASILGGTHQNLTTISESLTNGSTYKGLILGADADGDNLTYTVNTGPDTANGASVTIDADGSFTYTSDGADDSFTVNITDDDNNTTVHTVNIDIP